MPEWTIGAKGAQGEAAHFSVKVLPFMPKSRSRKRGPQSPRRTDKGGTAPVPASSSGARVAVAPGSAFADAEATRPPVLPDLPVFTPDEVSERIVSLDFLRGLAVIGILFANLVAFGLPNIAGANPFAIGMTSGADVAAWLLTFLLVDGKMRALFSLMFGASMLLVMESAETRGQDGLAAHRRRMVMLIPIGLAHYALLWDGDILVQLAIAGLIGTRLARLDQLALLKWGLGLIALQWVLAMVAVLPPYWLRAAADAAGASPASIAAWRAYADVLGIAPSAAVAADIAVHQSGYGVILMARLSHVGQAVLDLLHFGLIETLGFMAFGMAMLKGGFLAGQWDRAQYRATWLRAWLVGLVPMAGLAGWVLASRDPVTAQAVAIGWSVPLRLPTAIGHAALAMLLCDGLVRGWLRDAIVALGRLALSGYLLSSLLMTTLFYGYGLALYGSLGRAALLGIAAAGAAVLLAMAWLWHRRLGQGPAERVWRAMARGR